MVISLMTQNVLKIKIEQKMMTIRKKEMIIKKVLVVYVTIVVSRDTKLRTVTKEKQRKEKRKRQKDCR